MYAYNAVAGVCSAPYTCLPGTGFDGAWCSMVITAPGCPVPYTQTGVSGLDLICSVAPECPPGGTFSAPDMECRTVATNCPASYAWDGFVCATTAACGAGGTLDVMDHRCERPIDFYECPTGMVYDITISQCASPAVCPSGGSINYGGDVNMCGAAFTSRTCPGGSWYDPNYNMTGYTSGVCFSSIGCPTTTSWYPNGNISGNPFGGLFGAGGCMSGKSPACQLPSSYGPYPDPPGTYFDGATNSCRAAAVCPDGGVLDPSTNRCAILISNLTGGGCDNGWRPQPATCPDHGYAPYSSEGKVTYDSSTNQCYFHIPWGYYYWSCSWYSGWWWDGDASANGKCLAFPTTPEDNTVCQSERVCLPRARTTTVYPSSDNTFYWCQDPELNYLRRNQRIAAECSASEKYNWYTSLANGYTDPNNRRCQMSAFLTCPTDFPYGCYGPNGACWWNTCGKAGVCPDNTLYDQPSRKCLKAPLSVQCTDNVNQYYPLYDNTTYMCRTPMDFLCSPGQYNQNTGYCETPVVRVCPPQYVYNAGTNKCERSPFCTPVYASSGLEGGFASPYAWDNTTEKYKRAADNNTTCIDASSGAVLWTDNTSWFCLKPSAAWYDSAKDNCYASPVYTCLAGYTWDNGARMCTAPYNCINGGLLNTTAGLCQAYPTYYCQTADYTFNITTRMCQAVPSCIVPGAYDPMSNFCLANVTWQCRNPLILDNSLAVCWISAQCYPGGGLNGGTDRCEAAPIVTCPPQTPNYDSSAKVCWSDPECPGVNPSCPAGETGPQVFGALPPPQNTYLMCYDPVGGGYHSPAYGRPGTLDRSRNICTLNAADLCGTSAIFSLDTTTVPYWTCQVAPPCPAGSAYDNAANTCVGPATHTCPSALFTYNPVNRFCEADHLGCGSGVMDNATGLCDMGFSTCPKGPQFPCMTVSNSGCPAGYSMHPTDNVCTSAVPACQAPGTMDATKKICTTGLTLDPGTPCSASQPCVKEYRDFLCVDAGSSYDSASGKCVLPASLKTSCVAGDTCVDSYALWNSTCVVKYNARWSTNPATQVLVAPADNTDYLYAAFCADNVTHNISVSFGCAHGAVGADCGPCKANFTGVGKCATRVVNTLYWGNPGVELCSIAEAVDDNTLVCPAATTNYCVPSSGVATLCCYNTSTASWMSRTSQVLGSAPVCASYGEIGSCDPGYTFRANSVTATECQSSMNLWGTASGFPDCSNYSAYRCVKKVGIDCPPGYQPNAATGMCAKSPDCPSGGFTWDNNVLSVLECNELYTVWGNRTGIDNCLDPGKLRCTRDTALRCPAGYIADQGTGGCWTVPACSGSGTYDLANDRCVAPNNGVAYCSDSLCADSTQTEDTPTTPGGDNVLSSMDNCAGVIKIFSGTDSRCRTKDVFSCSFSGLGCCTKEKVCGGMVKCSDEDIKTMKSVKNKMCHLVGGYCSKKIKYVGTCIQRKNTYCCFKSKLGRIIQEQARPQLKWDWGSPTGPNCRGFTPEDFQMIDFTTLDLSEFYADVQAKVGAAVSNKLEYQLQNFQNQVNFK